MSTELAVRQTQGLVPSSVAEMERISEILSKSSIIPADYRNKPSDVFLAVSLGLELGFSVATSLMSISVIKGRPTLYAQSMVALCLSQGAAKYFKRIESTNELATYETCRVGGQPIRETFTIDDAKTAGLSGDNWRKYPRKMLEARAKSFLARDVYPDILHGLYSAEEVKEESFDDNAIDVYSPPEEQHGDLTIDLGNAITESKSIEQLESLIDDLSKIPKGTPAHAELASLYASQRDKLTKESDVHG